MLSGFAGNAAVQAAMAQACDALGEDLSALIADGPAEQLNLTANTQPAMLASSYAFYRAWIEAGGRVPDVMAGHSLGEYTALTAAASLPLAAAVKLVRFRAQAMQDAVPVGQGGMAALLGLDDEMVRAVCAEAGQGEVVEAVNFNAPAQVVIAGHRGAVERACELAKAKGAKRALPLPVSAPFHSSLLRPASDKLRARLADTALNVPAIPVINNVDVQIVMDPEGIRDALARQAASAVRWVQTIQAMAAMGVTHVVECGPGKVLAGLTKRIDANLVNLSIGDEASLQQTLAAIRSEGSA
jgi:[acyl-carrier-protein] S-malonyltransferase